MLIASLLAFFLVAFGLTGAAVWFLMRRPSLDGEQTLSGLPLGEFEANADSPNLLRSGVGVARIPRGNDLDIDAVSGAHHLYDTEQISDMHGDGAHAHRDDRRWPGGPRRTAERALRERLPFHQRIERGPAQGASHVFDAALASRTTVFRDPHVSGFE